MVFSWYNSTKCDIEVVCLKGFRGLVSVFLMVGMVLGFGGCGMDTLPAESDHSTVAAPEESSGSTVPEESSVFTEPSIETTAPMEPEGPSLLFFLKTAMEPVGSTMYVWGGGWNEADTGAGVEAVTLGVSPRWEEFAAQQDSSYNYKDHRYQIHDGLDCSGYVGWAVYNTLETEDGQDGYVGKAAEMAQTFAELGLGDYIPAAEMTQWLPGDIMSMKGHVWISLGMCDDGSVLLVHSSPPGVILCGTALPDGSESDAVRLARSVMKEHYPDWYSRFPDCSRSASYLEKSSAMRWSRDVLKDSEGVVDLSPEDIIALLFEQTA